MRPTRAGTALWISASAILSVACAGIGDVDCRSASWYGIGARDALVYGLRPQIDQYAARCAREGIQLAEKDYLAGWVDGERERERRMSGSEP